jgi:hypothetical protein
LPGPELTFRLMHGSEIFTCWNPTLILAGLISSNMKWVTFQFYITFELYYHSEWKNKTFEACVLNKTDSECNLEDGSVRDLAIVCRH